MTKRFMWIPVSDRQLAEWLKEIESNMRGD